MRYATVPESHAAHEASMVPPPPAEPHPAPLVTSLETLGWAEWPASPRSLAKLAKDHGWDARIGFSRGYLPGGELADIIGVWVDGYGLRAGAFWQRKPEASTITGNNWTAEGSLIWTTPGIPFPYANHTELKVWIKARGQCAPSWFAACRTRVMDAREAAKAKASTGAKAKTREHGG